MQTRRQFITETGTVAGGLGLGLSMAARTYAQSPGANDKISVGLIGCGTQGRYNFQQLLKLGVRGVAVCDVDEEHLRNGAADAVAAGQPAPKQYKDFRQLLENKEIDAVIIGTPDHWHALIFIAACQAGKDIWCEKPISHNLMEAKAMLNAARRHKPVVQIGTWQRSMKHFQDAIGIVQSGMLGKINICRAWTVLDRDIGRQPTQTPPASLDWNFWLGPAHTEAYAPNRCHDSWRWFWNTGGSLMTDWGVHMIDIVLLAMRESDPLFVTSYGGILTSRDDRDTPDTLQASYRFPNWILTWEHRFNNPRGLDGGISHGAEFIGEHGSLVVDRERYVYYPNPKDGPRPPESQWADSTHWQNFLDCIRSRKTPNSDIESMAKTTILCHLGNIALQGGTTVQWDAAAQDVAHRSSVAHCLAYQREYRKPWKLEMHG
ncbi:MAG TPA: Gfo/Idh/MocA family oxidoreductase [Verrucomicrobiae bacterium]|jgi:predicted dehydrogenase